jgi:crossover junction endodeoxyribonuclease RusA
MTVLHCFVPGLAKPQGSKRHVGNGIMVEQVKGSRPWRTLVAHAAGQRMAGPPIGEALEVTLGFYFPRPKSHSGKKGLKPSAPPWPTGRNLGDADKLARGVLDALTGIVFADDSQVARLLVAKRWADESPTRASGVLIRVDLLKTQEETC